MADAPRGATAPIPSAVLAAFPHTSNTPGLDPEARRHYCSRCGHSGDYAGTGPHTCPGCDCKLSPVPSSAESLLPGDLPLVFTPDPACLELALADRVAQLSTTADELFALLSVCAEQSIVEHPSPVFYRKRVRDLLYLAERLAERLALVLANGSLLELAAAGRKTEGGTA